jgi:uncharacterized protein (DUF305 family)
MPAGMNIRFANDADEDFIRGMIPHSSGRNRDGADRPQIRQ